VNIVVTILTGKPGRPFSSAENDCVTVEVEEVGKLLPSQIADLVRDCTAAATEAWERSHPVAFDGGPAPVPGAPQLGEPSGGTIPADHPMYEQKLPVIVCDRARNGQSHDGHEHNWYGQESWCPGLRRDDEQP